MPVHGAAQRHLEQQLRFGARHQDALIHQESSTVELAVAQNVRHGFTASASPDRFAIAGQLARLEHSRRLHQELHAVERKHVAQEELGIQTGARVAALLKVFSGEAEHLADGPLVQLVSCRIRQGASRSEVGTGIRLARGLLRVGAVPTLGAMNEYGAALDGLEARDGGRESAAFLGPHPGALHPSPSAAAWLPIAAAPEALGAAT